MTLLVLAYLGGVLTIVSPCILPVLPFVFARADRPFIKSGLPMLVGMAVTFAAIATLAVVAGAWAVDANQYARAIALVVLAAFGLTLIFPGLADLAMRPFVNFGAKLSSSVGAQDAAMLPSFLLGVATGFLWAPCAGPILGLILTGAALNGANVTTSLLLFAPRFFFAMAPERSPLRISIDWIGLLEKRAGVEHTRIDSGKFIRCPSFSRAGSRSDFYICN